MSFALLATLSQAQGYGTSSITLNPPNGTVTIGTSTATSYTVSLATGGVWGTNLEVQNSAELAHSGITVTISNPSGDPPFSGDATMNVSSSALPGTYNVTFVATGDDPSQQPATFALTVAQNNAAATTTANATNSTTVTARPTTQATTAPATEATTSQPVTTTVPGTGGAGGQAALYASIAAVIVLFAVIAVALKFA